MAQETFQEFYTEWIDEQKQELHHLLLASKTPQQPQTDSSSSLPLSLLVTRTVAHYEKYYTTKSNFAKTQVLLLLSPPWTTSLEDAFIWVGGWRPTTAFHLLYSKSSLQSKNNFTAMIGGGPSLDLGNLSSEQLRLIEKLQRSTAVEERKISEKMAKQQERVADAEMVELSHSVNESSQAEEERGIGIDDGKVEWALKSKEEGFQKVLQSADDLRLRTLKGVIKLLSPIQAIHFLIAAAELHLRLHEWGTDKEEREAYERTPSNAAAANSSTVGEVSTS